MTAKGKTDLTTDINNNVEDNTANAITAADVRQRLIDIVDSMFNNIDTTDLTSLAAAWIAASAAGPASLDFAEDTDNGTNYVRVTAPSAIAANRTITWPDKDGTVAMTSDTFGKQSMPLPAFSWRAKAAKAPAPTSYQDVDAWSFSGSTEQRVRCVIPMPKGWNESTITYRVWCIWDTGGGAGESAVFKMAARAYSHDDAAWTTTDLSTGVQSSQADWTADDDVVRSAESSALTIDGTPAAEDLVLFELWRDPADAADDSTDAVHVIAVMIYYTTDTASDA